MNFRRAALAGASIAVLSVTPLAAQEYPPTGGDLAVSSGTVAPGGTVTVSGEGCAPLAAVALAIDDVPAGDATSDAAGAFSASVTVPNDAAGSVEISATCDEADGGVLVLSATVTVSSGGGAGLPFTGASSTFPTTGAALAVLVLGAALVVGARRRALGAERT